MSPDLVRQIAIVVAFVATIAVNGAANLVPLNGQTTAEISDRWQVLVTPAGYVFSIWGLIYLGQLAFTIDQARPSRRTAAVYRRLGLLPALAGLLVTLIAIHLRIAATLPAPSLSERLAIRWPFSIYLGWITVATIVNVAVVLSWAGAASFFSPGDVWAALVLVAGFAIAAVFVVRERDAAFGFVIAWAYVGIAVKEAGVVLVAGTAMTAALVVGALAVLVAVGAIDRASSRSQLRSA
jgi:hypothetical protein